MKLSKPYYRIARPLHSQTSYVYGMDDQQTYIADVRYADDRMNLIRAYHIIEQDFKKLLEYIEPSDGNLTAFSQRTYELLLRAATEFEANAKGILAANGYTGSNVIDYYKVNIATKLSDFEVHINIWDTGIKVIKPFAEWATSHSLTWYQGYNSVKHNRKSNFHLATFENCLNAIGALYCILFAQFNSMMYAQYRSFPTGIVENAKRFMAPTSDLLFAVTVPLWPEAEMYEFNWPTLRTDPTPFVQFQF